MTQHTTDAAAQIISSYTKNNNPLEFQGFTGNSEHLDRHLKLGVTVGSVLLNKDGTALTSEQREEVARFVDNNLANNLVTQLQTGADTTKPLRAEIRDVKISDISADLTARDAVLDAAELDNISGIKSNKISLPRDPRKNRTTGAPDADVVNIVIVEPESIPTTDIMHIVGGSYGPTEKVGPYTIMPGKYAEPFSDQQAWDGKLFLGTPEQVESMIAEIKLFRKNFESEVSEPVKASGLAGRELGVAIKAAMEPYAENFANWDVQIKTAQEALKSFEVLQEYEAQKQEITQAVEDKSSLAAGFPEAFEYLNKVFAGTHVESIVQKMAELPLSADNAIFLSEMSNCSSKIAEDQAKGLEGSAKTEMKEASGKLMKAAKKIGLQGSIRPIGG